MSSSTQLDQLSPIDLNALGNTEQYGRYLQLIVSSKKLGGIDLSLLRTKFSVKRSGIMSPNMAEIRVYNVATETALLIQQEFNDVVLQAGYETNYGIIFTGNIIQILLGREDATTTYIDIIAADGDRAYNFAVVNTTIKSGSTLDDQFGAVLSSMNKLGVQAGYSDLSSVPTKLPRGKVMYGSAKNLMRSITDTSNRDWSIQNQQMVVLSKKTYLPGKITVLTSKTGLIGSPQQTTWGVNMKCLLNPNLKVGGRVQINNASVQGLKIDLAVAGSPANIPAPLTADGVYYLFCVEYQGDSRGVEWYSNLICLNMDVTTNPLNSLQVG